ncbi:hypothetical protein ACMYR3_06090 [Ampullimonas aquatilis]|uniref:hypothetical protein n=1 Tax=Ampullimonas aquatilis TaxID=1341549 RepID=UPI003C7179F8
MSIERKDIRFKLDHEVHEALKVLADVDGRDLCDLLEQLVIEFVDRRVQAATVITSRLARRGLSGNGGE